MTSGGRMKEFPTCTNVFAKVNIEILSFLSFIYYGISSEDVMTKKEKNIQSNYTGIRKC